MFKRMSALVRRDGDTRDYFSHGWIRHAQFIAELPGLRGYVQNHVEEDYRQKAGAAFLRVDGFVELLFESPEAMARAFDSPAAREMAKDEPNFLGHGSGYALSGDLGLRDAESGNKLIIACAESDPARLAARIAAATGEQVACNAVTALIAKPGMAPPQAVSSFLHLLAPDAHSASELARDIANITESASVEAAIFRVRTVRFV